MVILSYDTICRKQVRLGANVFEQDSLLKGIKEQEVKLFQLNVDTVSTWLFSANSIFPTVTKKLNDSQYQSDAHSKIERSLKFTASNVSTISHRLSQSMSRQLSSGTSSTQMNLRATFTSKRRGLL
jgi:hypothetical protein